MGEGGSRPTRTLSGLAVPAKTARTMTEMILRLLLVLFGLFAGRAVLLRPARIVRAQRTTLVVPITALLLTPVTRNARCK